ncbi:MAG: glycosyltransferase family 4 protein [Methylobacteriaceae bacterium]|nr:glycosyltransferase family 4 protein [Methylobacteriaceae bacterium]
MTRRGALAYLSLETPREGQASRTHVDEVIGALRRLGWRVDLYATGHGGASARGRYARRILDYLAVEARLARRLSDYDALYVRAHFAAAPVVRLARARGLAIVHEINGAPSEFAVTYPGLQSLAATVEWLYRAQFRSADHLVAVTPGLAQWARDFAGHRRVAMVPNGANGELFVPSGPRCEPGYAYVIFVGGLVAWHGVDTMLAALDDPAWPPALKLVVVGDGVERARLEAAAGHPRLVWLGRRPYAEVPALLRGATAALCVIADPHGRSASGVAPLKLFEAMGCAAPVIVSDLPFQGELVRRIEAGLVVPPADPAALARAVAQFAGDPAEARRMGANGARHVADEASWARRVEAIDAILRDATARR